MFTRGRAEDATEQGAKNALARKQALTRKQALMHLAGVVFVIASGAVGGAVGTFIADHQGGHRVARPASRLRSEEDEFARRRLDQLCSSNARTEVSNEYRHVSGRDLTLDEAARACAVLHNRPLSGDTAIAQKWGLNGKRISSNSDVQRQNSRHSPSVLSVGGTTIVRRLGTCDYEGCASGSQCWME